MEKLLVLTLDGNFATGFDIRWEIGPDGKIPYRKGLSRLALPPCPDLVPAFQAWQNTYRQLDGSRIKPIGDTITNVKYTDLHSTCQQTADTLERVVNDWFDGSPLSRMIHQDLLTNPEDEYRVIIGTEDPVIRETPWLLWQGWNNFQHLEISLGTPYNKRRPDRIYQQQVRVLVILGNSDGIDIEADRHLLENYCQGADVKILPQPSIDELRRQLSDERGWDIIFFSGHSRAESANRGRIYLNATDSLTMEDLRQELQIAIEKGLQLAIFNSCEGLGIAVELEALHIPQVIVMRQPVPDRVAQYFLEYFLAEFTSGKSLYQSVSIARRRLAELESNFPCASWLPAILQNCLEIPPTWQSLGSIPKCPYRSLADFTEDERAASTLSLTPIMRSELIDTIIDRSHQLNVQFEEGVIEKILDSGFTKSYSLPLLESILAQLWAKQQKGYLTHRAYEDIGGIERFLTDRAEEFCRGLKSNRQEQIRNIFIQLVRVGDSNNILYPRKAARMEIGEDNWLLINDLAMACLVVVDQDNSNQEEIVELIHKSLIHWHTLSEWMKVDGNFRRWQERLKDPIAQWVKSDRRDTSLLLRGSALNIAEEYSIEYSSQISSQERKFIIRSATKQKQDDKSKKRFQKLLVASLIAVIAIISFFWVQSEQSKHDSVINSVRASTKNAELLFENGNQSEALQQADEAAKLSRESNLDSDIALPAIVTLEDILLRIQQKILSQAATEISHSQDGMIVAFDDLKNQLNINTYDKKHYKYTAKIYPKNNIFCRKSGTFCKNLISNNGQYIITANRSFGSKNTLKLWRVNSNIDNWTNIDTKYTDKNITALALSPNSQELAVAFERNKIQFYSISNNILTKSKNSPIIDDYIESLKFTPDSQEIIIGTVNGIVEILDKRDLKITPLDRHLDKQVRISALDISPDGKKIAVGDEKGVITLWDIQHKRLLDINQDTKQEITELNFKPDNQSIISSDNREIKIWMINNNKLTLSKPLIQANNQIDSINFSPDGNNIVFGDRDGLIVSWQLNHSNDNSIIPDEYKDFKYSIDRKLLPPSLQNPLEVQDYSINPVTGMMAMSIRDNSHKSGTVTFRSQHDDKLSEINHYWNTISGISSLSFSHDGKVLLTGNEKGQLQLWNLEGKLLKTIDTAGYEIAKVKFGSDDREIIAVDINSPPRRYYRNLKLEDLQKKVKDWSK